MGGGALACRALARRGRALREPRDPLDPASLGEGEDFHGYLDTQRIAAACDEMAAAGIAEATAASIGDA